ncbi:hypothetical protein [Streptomyces sp. NPDC005438]|uniref:hypothetical protein n=1 Tax=Streptomyces sp. NPDC005438 TaxID=3156880 RepID=UPI0033AA55C2
MPVDPTEPTETFEDRYEDEGPGFETPEADAAEQRIELLQQRDAPMTGRVGEAVDPADAWEQTRVVEDDEEDYR